MNDQYIRNIVRQEITAQSNASRFGITPTSNHSHTGFDSPRINSGDLIPGLRTAGSVEFDSAKDYRFNVNFQPSLVIFYGNPYHTDGGIDRHTFVFGQAALGQNLYFQPDTTKAVTVGGEQGIVQSSTMFMALNSGSSSSFQAISSQTHIIDVEESGSVVARATVSSYGQNFFTITVDTLADGWTILGNYFVM